MQSRSVRSNGMALVAVASALAGLACSSTVSPDDGGGGGGTTSSSEGGGQTEGGASAAGGAGQGGSTIAAPGTGGGAEGGGGAGGAPSVSDPNAPGPYAFEEVVEDITVPATDSTFEVTALIPSSGPSDGPYPVVVIAHGFQLPASQYRNYAERLASFGYVAILADYPTSFFGLSHVDVANDLLGALDWAATADALAGQVDVTAVGMTGHSLGGKASLLAATLDDRVDAVIALDPVDSSMSCSPQDCPDVSSLMSALQIPTGFLGEPLDGAGGFQPCAPAADNYQTFYAGALSPSFEVTVLGANHMSFLDDVASCGFTCSFCNMAMLDNATVNGMSRAYVVAFYERHLRNNTGYDTYLTGQKAQDLYVTPGIATIVSK